MIPARGMAHSGSGERHRNARIASYRKRVLWLAASIFLILAMCAFPSCATTPQKTQSHPTATPHAGPILVGANGDVSQAPGSQDEVSAAIDLADPSIILAGSNGLQIDPSVRVYGSTDAGLHWNSDVLPLPTISPPRGAADQWAAIGPDHRQAMSYIAFGRAPHLRGAPEDGLTVFVATRSGPSAAWQAPSSPVDGPPPPGGHDDKATLAADNSAASPYYGRLYVAWTR